MPIEAPPAAAKPSWNEVMPPARMQMIENEIAKLEKPLIRRAQLLGVAQAVQERGRRR